MRDLRTVLSAEKAGGSKNGIYHRMQIDFAYNSNHIEGSRLTHEQTRFIFDTKTISTGGNSDENASVNDIIETVNHFRCFDHILDTLGEPLTEDFIKGLHRMLKMGIMTSDSAAVIGEYKKYPNEVGFEVTSPPERVQEDMAALIGRYAGKMSFYDIAAFHAAFEKIHPFYDGNGRAGRLIMFKQCLESGIVPFIISERTKMFYYKGLAEWNSGQQERLINVFLAAQDDTEQVLKYFRIDYDRRENSFADVKAEKR